MQSGCRPEKNLEQVRNLQASPSGPDFEPLGSLQPHQSSHSIGSTDRNRIQARRSAPAPGSVV
jgi:hypothetical protein